jgi:hypothetical protein
MPEMVLASRVDRFFAKGIDELIKSFGAMAVMFWMFRDTLPGIVNVETIEAYQQLQAQLLTTLLNMGAVSGSVQLGIFAIQAVFLTMYGQTIGKMAMRIRVINVSDGQNGGFFPNVAVRAALPGIISILTLGIFSLIDCLYIFRKDRRCLHDLMAGTTVVKGHPMPQRKSAEQILAAAKFQ